MRGAVLRRREFLASASLSVLALAACATTSGPAAGISADDRRTLTRVARLLYPHEAIDDAVYAEVVDGIVANPANAGVLAGGLSVLDGRGRGAFLAGSEAQQVEALTVIEGTPFFVTMRGSVQAALYERPEVWAMLGYPGPALPFGGYVDKGFDDIDWLPA